MTHPTSLFNLREAGPADILTLVKHRRAMFDEMVGVDSATYTVAELNEADPAYQHYLAHHLGGSVRAWLVEVEGKAAASGAVTFYEWPPRPGDIGGRAALVHSVYTEPAHRQRGLARRIVQAVLEACRTTGYRTLSLHASSAGRPLYESLGFKQTREMRLVLRDDPNG